MTEVPGGSIYTNQRGDLVDVLYIRQPELAGPIWEAVLELPKKMSDGSIRPTAIEVEPKLDRQMGARRLAEVTDWLVALYQIAERMDAKYPDGYESEQGRLDAAKKDASIKRGVDAAIRHAKEQMKSKRKGKA